MSDVLPPQWPKDFTFDSFHVYVPHGDSLSALDVMTGKVKWTSKGGHWTGNAGKVLKWSGPFDPYPLGELGVIKEGAYADILLWNGDPTQDINLILDEAKLNLIMKDGVIYKNTLRN